MTAPPCSCAVPAAVPLEAVRLRLEGGQPLGVSGLGPGGYALLLNRTTADDGADNLVLDLMRSICDVLNSPESVLETDWDTGGESLFDTFAPNARP